MEKNVKKELTLGRIFHMRLLWLMLALVFVSSNTMTASAYSPDRLVPMGNAVGINISFEGAVVINVTDTSEGGSPAKSAGIMAGDIIIEINGVKIRSAADVKNMAAEYDGNPVNITVMRKGCERTFKVVPCQNSEGGYELGVWLRDSMSGLGTMTFYDPETGMFGALGHGVSDMDSGMLVPLRSGIIVDTKVSEIVAGRPGFPGQLRGTLNFSEKRGLIEKNTENGIFGTIYGMKVGSETAIPLCSENDVKVGKAVILCDVGDGTQEYEIEISRLYLGEGFEQKNILVTVTDERLLATTGGIVQGMSGSPIIQDGKLVGAVTHVLINNPCKGYGITIENMLAAMDENTETAA